MRIKRNNIGAFSGRQTNLKIIYHSTLQSAMVFVGGLLAMVGLTACSEYSLEDLHNGTFDNKSQIVLTFVTPNDGTSTRADGLGTRSADGDPDGYEAGIGYENTVNIDAGDYKMYFFSYSSGDEKGGTLIAEFKPESITSTSTSSTTTYTVTGDVPEELKDVSDFRIVMLANWGSYPSVTPGTTTIDDLVEGQYTTFSASTKFTIDADNLIPFYGVQEYSDVTFKEGTTTALTTPISLLRAVAKVEVILTEDSYVDAFDAVSIVNYNAQGYNAPAGVYTAADYDTNESRNPNTSNWPDEWVRELHLVGGANDTGSKTQAFTQIASATQDTWRIYVPEYSNSGDDYSYITVTVNGEQYNIYFADYTDEETDNTDTSNRYNIKRNNLYRFYVTYKYNHISVWVEKWDEVYTNVFGFDSDYVASDAGE